MNSIRQQVDFLQARLDLRAAFVAGELSATQVELDDMRLGVVMSQTMLQRRMESLSAQHARLAQLREQGMASDNEFSSLDSELQAVQAQLDLVGVELDIIDQKMREAAGE